MILLAIANVGKAFEQHALCSEECKNDGVCVALNTCACKHGFQLPLCDDIDECEEDPCPDGFSCSNTVGSFHCTPTPQDRCGQLDCSVHANCTDTNNTVSCQCHDGYSGDGFHCQKIACAPLQEPPNGNVTFSQEKMVKMGGYGYGTVATFTCDSSYTLIGSDRVHCEYTGSWSTQVPTCKATASCKTVCGQNGYCLSIGNGERCFCEKGFHGNGITCTEIDCPAILPPVNGYIKHIDGNRTYDQVHFSCDPGYIIQGQPNQRCTAIRGSFSGIWNGLPPTCQIACHPAACPLGSVCRLHRAGGHCSCPLGYEDTNNTCTIIGCGAAPSINNGDAVSGVNRFGSTVQYECHPGYYQDEPTDVFCSSNRTWLGAPPTCIKVSCDVTGLKIDNGDVMVIDELRGLPGVRFGCNQGYTLVGEESSFCLPTGQWTADLPVCKETLCPSINAIRNGNVSTTGVQPGNLTTVTCNPYFASNVAARRTCTETGQWDGHTPVCFPVAGQQNCSKPYWITPGDGVVRFSCSDSGDFSECVADCAGNSTYQPHGLKRYQCKEDNLNPGWMVPSPRGPRHIHPGSCVAPDNPLITLSLEGLLAEIPLTTHSSYLLTCLRQTINDTCSLQIQLADVRLLFLSTTRKRTVHQLVEMGITLAEKETIKFEDWKDHWNNDLSQLGECVRDIESTMKAPNNTWVCGNTTIYWLQEEFVLRAPELACPPGYSQHSSYCYLCPEGTYFSTDRQCEPCPVGFYQQTSGASECLSCPEGTTTEMEGSRSVSQCQVFGDCNCGTHECLLKETGYQCQCNLGYSTNTHNHCSDIDECEQPVCSVQSVCYNTPGSYICVCQHGYGGQDCVDIDECHLDVCPPDHTCINTLGSYNCDCQLNHPNCTSVN